MNLRLDFRIFEITINVCRKKISDIGAQAHFLNIDKDGGNEETERGAVFFCEHSFCFGKKKWNNFYKNLKLFPG